MNIVATLQNKTIINLLNNNKKLKNKMSHHLNNYYMQIFKSYMITQF